MNNDKESEIQKIIETLTTTGKKTISESEMKKLKSICKLSNDYVSYTYDALMTELRKDHSEVRYSALLIINELFCRSACFRQLLESELDEFLELVVETNLENPLPEPRQRAKDLKIKGLEFVKTWSSIFGVAHKRMELALQYLRKCKKADFKEMEKILTQREQHVREQQRQERVLNEKIHQIKAEMEEMSGELSKTLVQMENCFRLLIPHPTDELFSCEDFESSESFSSPSDIEKNDSKINSFIQDHLVPEESLRHHGIHKVQNAITIEIKNISEVDVKTNVDTTPIIENLNDLYKEMTNRFLPRITHWLKILTKGSNCEDALKKAIDMKQMVESAFKKYRDLKIKPNVPDFDDDEDDFIEVKEKEGYEAEAYDSSYMNRSVSQCMPSCSKNFSLVERTYLGKLKDSPKPDVAKLEIWEGKNNDKENETLKEADITSLQIRKINDKKFEPVNLPCGAPLPCGKLCPRKDKYKCPFHGKIIKRDSMGKPVDAQDVCNVASSSSAVPTVPDWQDPELLRAIKAATGIDLKMPPKKGKRKGTKSENGLTNIKRKKTSFRDKISKEILKGAL